MEEHWKKKTDGGDGFFPPDHPRDSPRSSAPPSPRAVALKALVSASSHVSLLAFPSWVFPMNAQQGPTPDSSLAPCPVSSSQESWKLSSSLSVKMFKLHPEPQLSQHQLLIIVQSKLPCSVSPTFQARWGRDMMRKTLRLFSCQLPQKVRARARPEAT